MASWARVRRATVGHCAWFRQVCGRAMCERSVELPSLFAVGSIEWLELPIG